MNDKSFANGNSASELGKTQRDTGFDPRPVSHWTLVLGELLPR